MTRAEAKDEGEDEAETLERYLLTLGAVAHQRCRHHLADAGAAARANPPFGQQQQNPYGYPPFMPPPGMPRAPGAPGAPGMPPMPGMPGMPPIPGMPGMPPMPPMLGMMPPFVPPGGFAPQYGNMPPPFAGAMPPGMLPAGGAIPAPMPFHGSQPAIPAPSPRSQIPVPSATPATITAAAGSMGSSLASIQFSTGFNLMQTSPAFQDLMCTVFLSNVGESVSDEKMTELLEACGEVKSWKRVVYEGKPHQMGFCIFKTPIGAKRAFVVLGGGSLEEDDVPTNQAGKVDVSEAEAATAPTASTLAAVPDSGSDILRLSSPFKLIVTVDKLCKQHLKAIVQQDEQKLDDEAKTKIKALIDEINKDVDLDALFARIERDRQQEEQRQQREYEKDQEGLSTHTDGHNSRNGRRKSLEERDRQLSMMQRKRNALAAFEAHLKRWEAAEDQRLRRLAIAESKDAAYDANEQKNREHALEQLARFDDSDPHTRQKELFYSDRFVAPFLEFQFRVSNVELTCVFFARLLGCSSHWVQNRASRRVHEQDADDADRTRERQESTQETAEQREFAAQTQPMATQDYVGRIMTKEERAIAIQELISKIPTVKDEVWNWPMKWQFLDQKTLEGTLRPFLQQRIVEVIGDEENDLTDFVVEKIKGHATAQAIVDELKPVLDDETEVFVMKLWRMAIYETEARACGL
eukprot:jgi/Hompol1/3175/HPOL_003149-RA